MWTILTGLAKSPIIQTVLVAAATLFAIWSVDSATVRFADTQVQLLIKDLPPSGRVMQSELQSPCYD